MSVKRSYSNSEVRTADRNAYLDLKPILSIVVPVYNEEGNVDKLIQSVHNALPESDFSFELILVDDGSQDRTWDLIKNASNRDGRVKGVSFSRNFGHQNAMFCGLHYASGKAIITMDGDLQHPPDVIPQMFKAWENGFKIVETKRIDSNETKQFKKISSRLFYWVFSKLSGLPLSSGTSDFRLIDNTVARAFREMRDAELFIRGISHWVGFPKTTITYHAGSRFSGGSKFSLRKMFRLSIASLFSFSIIPLKLGVWIGLLTSLLAFLEMLYIFVKYLQGGTVEGWASILTVLSFMFGVMFILIGILGAYLGNISEILKNRPRFLVNDTIGMNRNEL
jgi:polyisoprenyl-phosphate glycosyltransferase